MAKDEDLMGGIYQILCVATGKMYIGSAVQFRKRWRLHREQLDAGRHHSRHLQRAWDKHGRDHFVFEIAEVVENRDDLLRVEQQWLDTLQPHHPDKGYNISPTAGSTLGIKKGPEALVNLSRAKTGFRHTEESKAKMAAISTGKRHTEESKRKMSELAKGRVISPEQRARISATLTGRKASPETRAKLSAARMGNKNSLGRVHPPEIRAKISAAGMGRRKSPESIAKCQATWSAKKKIRFAHGDHPGGRIAGRSLGLEMAVA